MRTKKMHHQIVFNACVGLLLVCIVSTGSNAQNDTQTELTVDVKFATPCKTPDGQQGYCIEIKSCSNFIKLLTTASEDLKDFMRQSRCGPKNEGTAVRVCCGATVPTFTNSPIQVEAEEVPDENQEENIPSPDNPAAPPLPSGMDDPLPTECGKQDIPIRNRIFGGMHAQLGEFPWLGRIRHRSISGEENYGCTAFLIHRKFLLTAAHCVNIMATSALGPIFQVVLGEHDSSKDLDCVTNAKKTICADPPLVVDLKSRRTIIHPKYKNDGSDASHYFDIALIQMKKIANFTDYIQPICLSENASDYADMYLGGWGRTESASYSNIKLKVEVPRANRGECHTKYRSMGVNVDNSQMCAGGTDGKDSCNGDSGGPLMAHEKERWFAEGIVSFGAGCGVDGWPGVYTYVPHYINWIKKQVIDRLEEDKVQSRIRKAKNRRRSF